MACKHADFLGWCELEVEEWTDDGGCCLVEDMGEGCPCPRLSVREIKELEVKHLRRR